MSEDEHTRALSLIKQNIDQHGFHVYIVGQAKVPRFAYTIGLTGHRAPELVLAGAIVYSADDVDTIVHAIGHALIDGQPREAVFDIDGLGSFSLRPADRSWTRLMMLGGV